jgi:hypothetical protein
MLNCLQESGKPVKDPQGRWGESAQPDPDLMLARVDAVFEQRPGRLKPGLVELLGVAGAEGEVGVGGLRLHCEVAQALEKNSHWRRRQPGGAGSGARRCESF